MESTKNSNVTREVERLLASVKDVAPIQFKILRNLLDEVYLDPTIGSPETTSKDIENKLYQWIDHHVRFDNPNNEL